MGHVLLPASIPPAGAPGRAGAEVDVQGQSASTERDDVALLTGEQAGELLWAVLHAEGVVLTTWAVDQVHHRPGVGVTVGYAARWRAGDRHGEEYLLATTAPVPPPVELTPVGRTTVLAGDCEVTVWRHPFGLQLTHARSFFRGGIKDHFLTVP